MELLGDETKKERKSYSLRLQQGTKLFATKKRNDGLGEAEKKRCHMRQGKP